MPYSEAQRVRMAAHCASYELYMARCALRRAIRDLAEADHDCPGDAARKALAYVYLAARLCDAHVPDPEGGAENAYLHT